MYRVLVIQDRSSSEAHLRMMLEGIGLVVYYETPVGFFENDRWEAPVDLVAVDLEPSELPPNMSGWDLVQMFKERNHTGLEPQMVVMTRFDDVFSHLLGTISTVSAYLVKPVSTVRFISTVQRLLEIGDASTVR